MIVLPRFLIRLIHLARNEALERRRVLYQLLGARMAQRAQLLSQAQAFQLLFWIENHSRLVCFSTP